MKRSNKLATSTNAANESKIQALTAMLLRAKTQDERSVLIEALAEANNMNIVVGGTRKTPARSHDCCTTLSPYKSDGSKRPQRQSLSAIRMISAPLVITC